MFACTKLHKEMKFETDTIQVLVLSWLASFVSRLWKDDRCRPKKPTFKNMYTKSRKASFENCFNKITKNNYPRYALKYIYALEYESIMMYCPDLNPRCGLIIIQQFYILTNVPNLLMQFCDVSYFLILVANHHKRTF